MPSYPFNVADGLCAGVAQAVALCTLVIRGAQRDLTKAVARTAAAEHALSTALNAVVGESSSGRLALEPAPSDHVASPDPYAGEKGGPGGRRRSRTLMGIRGPGRQLGSSLA